MLKFLKINGIAFIFSVFLMGFSGVNLFSSLLFISTLTLFVIAVIINIVRLKGKYVFKSIADEAFDNGSKYWENKKFGIAILNFIAYPLCIIGICFVAIDLVCMWLLLAR